MLERTRPVPRPLTFEAEHYTVLIRTRATRRAQATANRDRLTLWSNFNRPASKEIMRLIGAAQSERHPDVTFRIRFGAKCELVPFGISGLRISGQLRLSKPMRTESNGVVVPYIRIGVAHELENDLQPLAVVLERR